RSWLLAQLYNPPATVAPEASAIESSDETVRWYTRESHQRFDVCADDHCQRYQGVTKAFSPAAYDAVKDTRGKILVYGGDICDARYSKSCGGVTEVYSAAWDNTDIPYLSPVYDGPGPPEDGVMPLTREENAIRWISSSPAAFCNTSSADLLSKILPGFDQETRNFYRWEVVHDASELGELVSAKLGVEFGRILDLIPLERGPSGRIVRLRIAGEKRTLVIGKELEIRRALSQSHLYSSAFVVHKEHAEERGRPPMRADNEVFRITGAGWGHGVGMCQIGAAVMADQGYVHDQIVAHYFRGSTLRSIY
ncbi:MAG TPA: SpoIID/LytB domain-containing protein, partial [Blastocatellia bacterium]|nr:SpoIID/LytB domain-containing protein [Blastocatellia bacterium]